MKPEPFLGWPGWPNLRRAWLLSGVNGAWFVLVYGGCDWITAHRTTRVPLALPGEMQNVPFVPWMVVFYMSIYLLFLAGPFVLRGRREFQALIKALATATLIGGVGFLLFPASSGYPPPGNLGRWAGLYRCADRINLDYNMAPSLHVALSVCCVAAFAPYAPVGGRRLLWSWAAGIALSTMLIHQHYLVDALTGWLLGFLSWRALRPDGRPSPLPAAAF